jgi:hypothetical protein
MIKLDKINHDAAPHVYYTFDITADAYWPAPLSEYLSEHQNADDIYTISVHLELEPGRNFSGDILCESCDDTSAPYFWFHDYFGAHHCFSHLPESTQTEILAQINAAL